MYTLHCDHSGTSSQAFHAVGQAPFQCQRGRLHRTAPHPHHYRFHGCHAVQLLPVKLIWLRLKFTNPTPAHLDIRHINVNVHFRRQGFEYIGDEFYVF